MDHAAALDRIAKLESEIVRLRADLVVAREEHRELEAELERERAGHMETARRLTDARLTARRGA